MSKNNKKVPKNNNQSISEYYLKIIDLIRKGSDVEFDKHYTTDKNEILKETINSTADEIYDLYQCIYEKKKSLKSKTTGNSIDKINREIKDLYNSIDEKKKELCASVDSFFEISSKKSNEEIYIKVKFYIYSIGDGTEYIKYIIKEKSINIKSIKFSMTTLGCSHGNQEFLFNKEEHPGFLTFLMMQAEEAGKIITRYEKIPIDPGKTDPGTPVFIVKIGRYEEILIDALLGYGELLQSFDYAAHGVDSNKLNSMTKKFKRYFNYAFTHDRVKEIKKGKELKRPFDDGKKCNISEKYYCILYKENEERIYPKLAHEVLNFILENNAIKKLDDIISANVKEIIRLGNRMENIKDVLAGGTITSRELRQEENTKTSCSGNPTYAKYNGWYTEIISSLEEKALDTVNERFNHST